MNDIKTSVLKLISVFKNRGKNFSYILIGSLLVKIVGFLSAMFLPRFLSKGDFGILTYVDNLRSYILFFNGLGMVNSGLKYCAQVNSKEKESIFFATIMIGVLFDFILVAITIALFIFLPLEFKEARSLLLLSSFLPIFNFLLEDMQVFLRACFKNKEYFISTVSYTLILVITQIAFAILADLNGVIVARYLGTIISIVLTFKLIKDFKSQKMLLQLPSKKMFFEMMRYGIITMLTNVASLMMQSNEMFMIGLVLKDPELLAEYKVATYILQVSLFLFQALLIFITPYFITHIDEKSWIWKKFKLISVLNAVVMIPIHIVLIVFSKFFLSFLFGMQYVTAARIMQTLLIASLFQALIRGIPSSILAIIGEEKFNLKVNVISVVIHCIIDYFTIKKFGVVGAAFALIAVYSISGLIMIRRLYKVCKV